MELLAKLTALEDRYKQIEARMAQPEIATNFERVQVLVRERASLDEVVGMIRQYRKILKEIEDTNVIMADDLDPDVANLARDELAQLAIDKQEVERSLHLKLLPRDPQDGKNIILEIRAGTGGQEACLFAADLHRMYTRYVSAQGWDVELLDSSPSDLGGLKGILLEVRGKDVFRYLKYERGVHRVQRVPTTEASGRLHTSTATVAVLPEPDEIDVEINLEDLRIDIFHAGGHGGQSVNKVATAVRIVHIPTGITAVCQDERSQLRNKQKALAVLRARVYEVEQRNRDEAITSARRSQVGTGERAEKIRTYNFPQDRVTDHRIGLTLHNLAGLLDGDLDALIRALLNQEQAQRLESLVV